MKLIVKKTTKINGEITISGSKNSCLPIIVASLLIKEKVIIKNVPFISDVISLLRILEMLGAKVVHHYNENKVEIISKKINYKVDSVYVDKLRASYYIMGALISRKKYFEIKYPGGCNFDTRPIDLHLMAFRKLNIEIKEEENLKFKVEELIPNKIILPIISVGATINIILATTISKGITIIENASIEPEVIDVINFLNKAGASITIVNRNIIIKGVNKLHSITYTVMPDRIEAGSYLLLASTIPNSKLTINNILTKHIKNITNTLKKIGCEIIEEDNKLTLNSPQTIKNIDLIIDAYPSFPTDLQPIISVALLNANEKSTIIDNIYPNRVSHIKELNKIGANIRQENKIIEIMPSKLNSGALICHDLRCGFALIIAGALSDQYIEIENANYILRGYENIINKLNSIGLKISQIM